MVPKKGKLLKEDKVMQRRLQPGNTNGGLTKSNRQECVISAENKATAGKQEHHLHKNLDFIPFFTD